MRNLALLPILALSLISFNFSTVHAATTAQEEEDLSLNTGLSESRLSTDDLKNKKLPQSPSLIPCGNTEKERKMRAMAKMDNESLDCPANDTLRKMPQYPADEIHQEVGKPIRFE